MARPFLLVTIWAAGISLAAGASAAGKHCVDEPRRKVYLEETLIGQLSPYGGEHQLKLVFCTPLIETPGVLFDHTNAQAGLVNYLSPTYVHQGVFLSASPLSLLELRAEVTGLYVWAFPLDGAGYHGFASYQGDARDDARTKDKATQATGALFIGSGTLRGAVEVSDRVKLLLLDTVAGELWMVGREPFNYNLRRDLVLARTDWLLKNTAAILAEIKLSDGAVLRIGPTDDLGYVPASGVTNNILGGLATVQIHRLSRTVRNFQPFLRAGTHTHHPFRPGYNVVAGINVVYELNPSP